MAKNTSIRRDEEAAAVVRDLATAPPPKGVETIRAASNAVYRSDQGGAGPERRSPPYNDPATKVGRSNMEEQGGSGAGAASESVAAASQTLQAFATEMQRTAKESIEQASHVLDQLRGAKSIEDVMSLQTTFMQQSFQRYTEFSKRIGEMMASSQTNFLQQSQAAMQAFKPPFG